MNFAIAIPARYASTRFPGKPLAIIAGKTMIQRVIEIAQKAGQPYRNNLNIFVTTDDKRISDHVQKDLGVNCIITPPDCATGSDRVLCALQQLPQQLPKQEQPDFVINLQGDAPFTPPDIIQEMIESYQANPDTEVITPVHKLSWNDLDNLRKSKELTPFSGTTAIIDQQDHALWFSKNIIPAIRNEEILRKQSDISPIYQHIGLYGFRRDILEKFCALEQGTYEALEGLEQLRMIENSICIKVVKIKGNQDGLIQSGIDSPEDIERAEEHITTHGEIIK